MRRPPDHPAALHEYIEDMRAPEEVDALLDKEPPLFWRHAVQECREAHEALDRLGAPTTKTVRRVHGDGEHPITLGLADRIRSVCRAVVLGSVP